MLVLFICQSIKDLNANLSKTEKKAQSFLVMAVLMSGVYNFATVAQATAQGPNTILISGPVGIDKGIDPTFGSDVINEWSDSVTLTVDFDGCSPHPVLKSPAFSKSAGPVPFCATGMSLNAGNGRCFIRVTCS